MDSLKLVGDVISIDNSNKKYAVICGKEAGNLQLYIIAPVDSSDDYKFKIIEARRASDGGFETRLYNKGDEQKIIEESAHEIMLSLQIIPVISKVRSLVKKTGGVNRAFNDYVSRGIAFYEKDEYKPAIENFQAALSLNPNEKVLEEFTWILTEEYSYLSAVREVRKKAEAMGIKLEDVDKTIAEYTEALKHNPNDASAKSNLASAYYIRGLNFVSKGDHDRAIADFSDAIKFEPDNFLALHNRGLAYFKRCDFDKAVADYEELLRFIPNNNDNATKKLLAKVYMECGLAHDLKGDHARAIQYLEKVLEFNPDDGNAREFLESAKARMAKH